VLPAELLRVSRRGGFVRPVYLNDPGPAEYVIDLYKPGLRLREARERLAEAPFDPKLARGLAHILERTLELEKVDRDLVARLRLEVFREASRQFPVVDPVDRAIVFERVAARFGITPEEAERLFTKAFEDELEIAELPSLTAEELVAMYNTSLIQTLLFKCTELRVYFRASGVSVKPALRALKSLGLMYVAEEAGDGGIKLTIDGPVSVLKQTERYGTRLAKFVPYVFGFDDWAIEATVRLHGKAYTFKEQRSSAPRLVPAKPQEELFDSQVEREFYRQLSQLCEVEREPEPLVVDGRIYVPDFRVGELYIEIAGFWTPDYLKRKFEKLSQLKFPILVLVDEKLAVSAWKSLPHYVVAYRERPRISDVYRYVRAHCRNRG